MQKSFGQGTSFQITGVDFKNDCLELKLFSRIGGSAHLKVMFGAGWQTRMTNVIHSDTTSYGRQAGR
jgi:hypothetical protein